MMKHFQFPSVFTSTCFYSNMKHDNQEILYFTQTLIEKIPVYTNGVSNYT